MIAAESCDDKCSAADRNTPKQKPATGFAKRVLAFVESWPATPNAHRQRAMKSMGRSSRLTTCAGSGSLAEISESLSQA